jgi:hypothetical protein
MTVKVTLPGGGRDDYVRAGDVYLEGKDGKLEVFRVGAEHPYSYSSGEWTNVEGDRKRAKKKLGLFG